jgi:hypothetical protein
LPFMEVALFFEGRDLCELTLLPKIRVRDTPVVLQQVINLTRFKTIRSTKPK